MLLKTDILFEKYANSLNENYGTPVNIGDIPFKTDLYIFYMSLKNPLILKGVTKKIYKNDTGYVLEYKDQEVASLLTFNNEGQIHSFNDKPSDTTTHFKENSFIYLWHKNGKLHRENGPCLIVHTRGTKDRSVWALNGVTLSKKEFDKEIKRIKHLKDKSKESGLDLTFEAINNKVRVSYKEIPYMSELYMYYIQTKDLGDPRLLRKDVYKTSFGFIFDYEDTSTIYYVTFNEKGELHSIDGEPSTRSKYKRDRDLHYVYKWFTNGVAHREDGPAYISNNIKEWWLDGVAYHSEKKFKEEITRRNILKKKSEESSLDLTFENTEQPIKIKGPSRTTWRLSSNGKLHKEDGPAVITRDGAKAWYIQGKLHRLDGPAIIWQNGEKEWWIEGERYFEDDYIKEIMRQNHLKKKSEESGLDLTFESLAPLDTTGMKEIPEPRFFIPRFSSLYELFHKTGTYGNVKKVYKTPNGYFMVSINPGFDESRMWFNEKGELESFNDQPAEIYNNERYNDITTAWYKNGMIHRENNPALVIDNKDFYIHEWFIDGKHHREDGPAVIHSGNTPHESWWLNGKEYTEQNYYKELDRLKHLKDKSKESGLDLTFENTQQGGRQVLPDGSVRWTNALGKLHRLDGPAIEYISGTKKWFVNGKKHRLDGPAIVKLNGTMEWWVNGVLHRLDGPAIIDTSFNSKEWWVNGKQHRLDGPAFVAPEHEEYWIDDVRYTKDQFEKEVKRREILQKGSEDSGLDLTFERKL